MVCRDAEKTDRFVLVAISVILGFMFGVWSTLILLHQIAP